MATETFCSLATPFPNDFNSGCATGLAHNNSPLIQLSEYLERDLPEEKLVEVKQKVQDKYRYVEQRRQILLKHCAEGYERNEWKFDQSALDNKLEYKRV